MPKTICQSEFGRIKTLFLKPAKQAFISDQNIASQWQNLNYTAAPSMEQAKLEYQDFLSVFQQEKIDLHFFPESDAVGMDSIYCRDASIATDHGMILCNMGKALRKPEPHACKLAFEAAGVSILGEISGSGTVEGGDVAWLDPQTLAVGIGYRTNMEGFRQLKALLNPHGVEVLEFHLPHYKGPTDVFHLMSIFSPVDQDLAVVHSPFMPINFRNGLLDRGYQLVEVPDAEFESMGCNVLAIAPRRCLMVAGNPQTAARLKDAGCEVITYTGTEISVKGGGGPTCLTRPIWREI